LNGYTGFACSRWPFGICGQVSGKLPPLSENKANQKRQI
jgi:hypothetical protein